MYNIIEWREAEYDYLWRFCPDQEVEEYEDDPWDNFADDYETHA